ncbi:porin PorA family protein [Rhodococcus pyridinivorans]|uniref:porin PorA family protein n=1 Tax=Rhodococcus pyridinivorans TaxID=103816 RepID=UPI00228483AB|nr:porin PorA family protein [Rhodococcus pyridinivorans]WAL49323.1 porin PorA family protein [Rhodococcus pyridinivorans]
MAARDALTDPVPPTSTADTTITLAADTLTGAPIDATLDQQVIVNLDLNGHTVTLIPVMTIDTALTDASVAGAATASATAASQLTLIGVYVPLALRVLGAMRLILAGVRRHPALDTSAAARATVDETASLG